jgi:hypothetical protein
LPVEFAKEKLAKGEIKLEDIPVSPLLSFFWYFVSRVARATVY